MGQKSKRVATVTTQCPCISREKNQKYLGTFIHKKLGNIDHFVTYQHIWIWGMTYWFEAWLDYAGFVRTYPFQLQSYGNFYGEHEVFLGKMPEHSQLPKYVMGCHHEQYVFLHSGTHWLMFSRLTSTASCLLIFNWLHGLYTFGFMTHSYPFLTIS